MYPVVQEVDEAKMALNNIFAIKIEHSTRIYLLSLVLTRDSNNFQEHLFGMLRLGNTKRHFKISIPRENEAT